MSYLQSIVFNFTRFLRVRFSSKCGNVCSRGGLSAHAGLGPGQSIFTGLLYGGGHYRFLLLSDFFWGGEPQSEISSVEIEKKRLEGEKQNKCDDEAGKRLLNLHMQLHSFAECLGRRRALICMY